MRRVFFIRHGARGDDKRNPAGIQIPPQRPLDPDISCLGEKQAEETGELLKGEGLTAIYASPFLRTTHTAAIVAEKVGLNVWLEWGFAESFYAQWFSDWPGTITPWELARRFPRVALGNEPTGFYPKCPENYWETHDRAARAMRIILKRHPGNILVVSHAAVTQCVPASMMEWKVAVGNQFLCGVTCVEEQPNGKWKALKISDTSHLTYVAE